MSPNLRREIDKQSLCHPADSTACRIGVGVV
jgi:hypothetical protein